MFLIYFILIVGSVQFDEVSYDENRKKLIEISKRKRQQLDGVDILLKLTFEGRRKELLLGKHIRIDAFVDDNCPCLKELTFVSLLFFLIVDWAM